MSVSIRIPTTFRELTKGESLLSASAGSLTGILTELGNEHPDFIKRILDENKNLQRFVNIFLDDEDIRFLDGLETNVSEGQTLSIVPAVAGGI
ncbi:MAG: molybdopterin synthase sulfur carrier subunit [Acidimicrobiaceae bacterium]|nr:molybdopterin synthase sulfur carrier subunit [Acidimicrobiaceae bacterium]